MIQRGLYLHQLVSYMWDGQIKVITGIRRCGKSVLLFELFRDYLLSQGTSVENIITIELDKRKDVKFRSPIALSSMVEAKIQNSAQQYYLFIDEIQLSVSVPDPDLPGEKVTIYDMLNELRGYKNLDVYVTGSNSRMLSSDIVTEFRGRSSQIHVYPLSFREFFAAAGGDKRDAFDRYMLYGGMPYLLNLKEDRQRKDYLAQLFNEVYIKDIIEREGIERPDVFSDILDFLASSVSSLTNPTNIANTLNSTKRANISPKTVSSYLEYLKNAFLIREARRWDIKGKRYFQYPNKYYYTDIGLRNARVNFRQFDPGHIMENILYNELIIQGYSVDVGVVLDRRKDQKVQKEIDFVVNQGDKKVYIQSAYEMSHTEKTTSELDSLRLTNDFFEKIVMRRDIPASFTDENGIRHINVLDFLLGKETIF